MESWSSLPESTLDDAGPESRALLRAGCPSFRSAARYLHELPYGRNTDRADFRLVLVEGRGTCSTKHALLAEVAREQDLRVSLVLGIYDMTAANTPGVGRVLAEHGLDRIPEAHCYLAYAGRRIDITRAGISPRLAVSEIRQEWTIEPSQIGGHKVAIHQRYLRSWLEEQRNLSVSFDELWRIREACIGALGAA